MSEERANCLEPSGSRCIVHGCINHRHQGRFIGDMCAPCHTYITTGKVGPTTSFLSRMDVLRTIAVSDWKTAGELRKMARDAISSENAEIGGSRDEDSPNSFVETGNEEGDACAGCRHLNSSGYAWWCGKQGCLCTTGAQAMQPNCREISTERQDRSEAEYPARSGSATIAP